jgi:hypothetical protein
LKQSDAERLKTSEVKLIRRAAGYRPQNRRRLLEELNEDPLGNKLAQYKKYLNHVVRMKYVRYPK